MEHTKKNILTFRSKHTIKSLLFTSFLAGMLGCTNSNKAEFDDSELQGLSLAITKLTEEKAKAEVELSKTAQEKTKLEYTNNQTAKELETVNKDLKDTTTVVDELKLEKARKKKEKKRLKEEKKEEKLKKKKDKEQNKKTALTTAEGKINECKNKIRELAEEKDNLLADIEQCKRQITNHNTEEEKTSKSLKECQEAIVESSNNSKALQQLLLAAKRLKIKDIRECIETENKTIQDIEKKITELKDKPKQTFPFFPGTSIEKEEKKLAKHKQKLQDLSKIQNLNEDPKKLSASIGIKVKKCEEKCMGLKQEKKDFKKKLDKIKAAKEKIETQISNGLERLEDIGHEITKAVKKEGKLSGKIETLQNNS